jgi:hypothetical protein
VWQTNDGEYILAGDTDSIAWLIKTDANGNAPATPTPQLLEKTPPKPIGGFLLPKLTYPIIYYIFTPSRQEEETLLFKY